VAAFDKALPTLERLAAAPDSRGLEFTVLLGACCANMGRAVEQRRQAEKALEWYDRAVTVLEGATKRGAPGDQAAPELRKALEYRALCYCDLKRFAEALPSFDRAIQTADGPLRHRLRSGRACALAHTGDHARATTEAAELAADPKVAPDALQRLAVVYSLSAKAVAADRALAEAAREKRAAEYAARAVGLLKRANESGLKASALCAEMKQNAEFDPIRARPEFANLLLELERK
jgi:tetratricopeptide (TPR) repeat protein